MNQKHSVVFFSAGVILILLLIIVGVPIAPVAQQTSDLSNEMPGDDGKSKENIAETKPVAQMNCSEIYKFITSFEKGWGNAITLYNENCT